MPSTLKRTQCRALAISRSFANAIRSKLSTPFFASKGAMCRNPPIPYPTPRNHHPQPRLCRVPQHTSSRLHRSRHPIHYLPVEILAHILVLGSEDDIMLPVIASHVCRAWRTVALRTPSLWTRISLSASIGMWHERLRRSKACPLHIQLLGWVPTRDENRPQSRFLDAATVQWYMSLVVPFIARWNTLEIQFTDNSPYLWNASLGYFSSRGKRIMAPSLEELTLIYRNNDDMTEFSLFSGYAPRLRKLTIDGVRLAWLPSLYGNLTYLNYTHHAFTGGHQAIRDVAAILAVTNRLTELRLLFPQKPTVTTYPAVSSHTTRISLPFLTSLHLRVESGGIPFELAYIATLLDTPSLTSLCLGDVHRRNHSFPNLQPFFQVYIIPRTLRKLRIEHGWYDPHLIFPILYALPNIRQLLVRRPHTPDQYFDLISRNRKGSNRIEDVYGYSYLRVRYPRLQTLWKT